jgi:anti-anti-sigma regulatory factor
MRSAGKPVVVKRMPKRFGRKEARNFYNDIQPLLNSDQPQIVFDMSETGHIDLAGANVLLQCLCEAMKCDGEVKLAGLTYSAAIVLELTRIGGLFEVYENSASAIRSFSGFHPNASLYPDLVSQAAIRIALDAIIAEGKGMKLRLRHERATS